MGNVWAWLALKACILSAAAAGFGAAVFFVSPAADAEGPGVESERPTPGVFLVAEEGMKDPRFRRTVILLTHFGSQGAMGLIINRPTGATLS